MVTNWQAPRRRVIRVEFAKPSRENWREILPESPWTIESFSAVGGKLIATYTEDVHSRVRVFEPDGTFVREVELPCAGTLVQFTGRWDRTEWFFYFTSLDRSPTIYRYDTDTGERNIWWREQGVPDLAQFELRQVWYALKDRTGIPMYLFHKRGLYARLRAADLC